MEDDARAAIAAFVNQTVDDLRAMETEAARFNATLADGLTDAIVYGESIRDVLVNSLNRAAPAAISSGLFALLSGGKPHLSVGGLGGLFSRIFRRFFASGGHPPFGKASSALARYAGRGG